MPSIRIGRTAEHIAALLLVVGVAAPLGGQSPVPRPVPPRTAACRVAPGAEALVALYQRWVDDVWFQGRLDLVPQIAGPTYVRHEADSVRTVTAAQYAEEIAATRRAMPDVRFDTHDCAAIGDRLWVRWTMTGTSARTGQLVRRMAMQTYRVAGGRLVETWVVMLPADAAWPDATARPGP